MSGFKAFCFKPCGCVLKIREDAKTLVQLRKYKEQPIHEAEARKLAQSLGRYLEYMSDIV
jgi:hypothetical protein